MSPASGGVLRDFSRVSREYFTCFNCTKSGVTYTTVEIDYHESCLDMWYGEAGVGNSTTLTRFVLHK